MPKELNYSDKAARTAVDHIQKLHEAGRKANSQEALGKAILGTHATWAEHKRAIHREFGTEGRLRPAVYPGKEG